MPIADRLSFQLYSARKFPPLDAQLAVLASAGYRCVEPFGALYGDVEALAEGLARHGLAAPSGHFDLALLERDTEQAIGIARRLGIGLVVAPFLAVEQRPSEAAGWRELGVRLSRVRQRLAEAGLRLAWHNHDFELVELADGSVPLDLILDADPALLWEADVGWLARAGVDPAAWLDRHAGRIGAVHLKDLALKGGNAAEDGWADVGHGALDWNAIVVAARRAGADLFVVEHDNPANLARCARNAIATVTGWGA